MARIVTKTYRCDVPAGTVKARMYYIPGTSAPTYAASFLEQTVTPPASQASFLIPGTSTITDGTYTLGASVFDTAGNESDIGAVVTNPFDFTALPAPTNGIIL